MKLTRMDPPGTWLHYAAVRDMMRPVAPKTFVDVGCGAGGLSAQLLSWGLTGKGVDFSQAAIGEAARALAPHVASGRYELVRADLFDLDPRVLGTADVVLCMMVVEHVEEDVAFVERLMRLARPEGHVMLAVPGRRDHWSYEDETVGHLRRYDRGDLERLLAQAGLEDPVVRSVQVPLGNALFSISDWVVRRNARSHPPAPSQRGQTEHSGIREIPFKTVFPAWCGIILNRYALSPFAALQRQFYRSNFGVEMLGMGRAGAS